MVEERTTPRVVVDPDVADLIPTFLAKRREDLARFRGLLAERQFEELRRHAHRLKGTGGSYGFPAISELAAVLERAATLGDGDTANATVEQLERYLAEVIVLGPDGRIETAP